MRVVQMNPYSTPSNQLQKATVNTAPVQKANPPVFKGIDFKNFKKDDWILLAIIAVLIFEGSEDYILLCALGYLFIMGL